MPASFTRLVAVLALALLPASPPPAPDGCRAESRDQVDPPIQVPEGFVVEKVAGPPLIERPIMAGFDDQGRLYVGDSAGVNLRFDELLKNPPHRIVRLEDTDGDGIFDKSVVFADKLTFPMGALWHQGSLYVCAPPSVWKLTDTDGDGVADKREEIVTQFGSNGNAADIHGPFLHPSGWIYWTDGRHGHEIRRADGSVMKGLAARVFRAKSDGSQVEVVCGGGMDNPVEVAFTEEGEALATVAIFHGQPRRMDSVIHCIWGGAFPYHECHKEFRKTGDLLPSLTDLGWVAPSGFMRYRSDAFGKGYQDNFFSAQFNVHKVQRHVIERDGATFKSRNEDFLVSTNPDFSPADILEDADGSLLVVDTGSWYTWCPTTKLRVSGTKGAIYRVRRKASPRIEDSRGLRLDPEVDKVTRGPSALVPRLDDPRFAVRDRAIQEIAAGLSRDRWAGVGDVLAPVRKALSTHASPRVRRNLVWTLARLEWNEAREAARIALTDKDASVRAAAAQSAALYREAGALSRLTELVRSDESPAVRREAAAALGRIRDKKAIPALFEGLRSGVDRFLEHALIYALIEIDDREATRPGLSDPEPRVRRGALIALDQMDGGNLAREEVTPCLDPSNPALMQAALSIVTARPAWANELLGLLREWLGSDALESNHQEELRGVLAAFAENPAIQDLVARTLRRPKTSAAMRLLLLEAMARAPLDRLPATWTAEVRWNLDFPDEKVVRQAVATLRSAGATDFDEALLKIARDANRSEDLRAEALAAAAPRISSVEPPLFQFLLASVDREKPVLLRLTAAQALGSAGLDDNQLGALTQAVANATALELPRLMGGYERSGNAQTGRRLVAALEKSAAFESLSADALRRAIRRYPDDVKKSAEPLLKRLEVDTEKMKARLAELEPILIGGDAARGREIFFGKKAACIACHTVQGQGGRVGPELSKIGSIRAGRDLLEAVVFPSASFVRGYEPYLIRTKDGVVIDGLIVRETADAIYLVLGDRSEKRVPRASIEEMRQSRTSIMPQGLDAQLARDELRDLIAFLTSLK